MNPLLLALHLLGCTEDPEVEPPPAGVELLTPEERLVRASLSLRGRRPTGAELDRVAEDPAQIAALVDAWVLEPGFGDTVEDMHAELLLVRTDADPQLPSLGPLATTPTDFVYDAASEEPLRLIRHVVTEGRPYTEIVTADYMLANEVLAAMYGIDIDPNVSGWRVARWSDGRPHAGILSSSELYRRHMSAGSNFHRLRANFLAEALLCESFARRDIEVSAGVDLTDLDAVARAVVENPNCVACHQALDPFAATLWGFKRKLEPRAVQRNYDLEDCVPSATDPLPEVIATGDLPTDYCYPLTMYSASNENNWEGLGLRPPGYYGEPVETLPDLGQKMAQDHRFSQCAVRRFYSWYAQLEPEDVPLDVVGDLQSKFEEKDFDARALAKAIVLSDSFSKAEPDVGDAPLLAIRPEAYAAVIEQYTGFRWLAKPNSRGCTPTCWEEVDLATSDRLGYRALAGGVDGSQVLRPTHTSTPTRVLVDQRFAAEAASFVVQSDLTKPPQQRRLLKLITRDDVSEAGVRAQLEVMYREVLGSRATTAEDIDEAWAVFSDAFGRSGDPLHAWTLSVALLLQDPRLLYY